MKGGGGVVVEVQKDVSCFHYVCLRYFLNFIDFLFILLLF